MITISSEEEFKKIQNYCDYLIDRFPRSFTTDEHPLSGLMELLTNAMLAWEDARDVPFPGEEKNDVV